MSGFYITKEMLLDVRVVEHGVFRLASGARKFELKSELAKMFALAKGEEVRIDQKLYEHYLRTCENALRQLAGITKEEMVSRLTVSLMDWMSDESATINHRAYVARELRELHGLDKVGRGDEETAKRVREFVTRTGKIPESEPDESVE